MGRYDKPDYEIEGQMSFEDLLQPPERIFAVSRIFARARKEMSLDEQKAFVYALSELRFTEEATSNIIFLDKKKLASILGVKSDTDHLSTNLYRRIENLPVHSNVRFSKEDIGFYDNGQIITRVTMFRNRVRIKFEEEYLPLFTGLTTDYITMWSSDIFQMTSQRTVTFYEYLRQITNSKLATNSVLIGIRGFKDMFDIPETGEGSYMRKDGHFDRPSFERYVINSLCDDMKHCKMIKLLMQPDGRFYIKEKQGKRVTGYRFYWEFSARPGIATAEEVQEIQERVDKDPQVLKVAKDIVNGKKKPKQQKKNSFTDFEQRSIDYGELERQLLRQQLGETSEK